MNNPLNIKSFRIDAEDLEQLQELENIHKGCFLDNTHIPDFRLGFWWVLRHEDQTIGFIGIVPSTEGEGVLYLSRVGILPVYRGLNLQCRLIRLVERFARKSKYKWIVSDCTKNPPSANSFIKCGYRTYMPKAPWSYAEAIYWRKQLKDGVKFPNE